MTSVVHVWDQGQCLQLVPDGIIGKPATVLPPFFFFFFLRVGTAVGWLSLIGLLQDRGCGVSEGPASREDSDGEGSSCFYGSDSACLGPHLMGCTGQLGCTGVWTAELGLINMAL